MVNLEVLRDSFQTTDSKIVMLVADGLGGLPHPDTKLSELETARTPNLDALASESACGLTVQSCWSGSRLRPGASRFVRVRADGISHRPRRS